MTAKRQVLVESIAFSSLACGADDFVDDDNIAMLSSKMLIRKITTLKREH